MSNGDRERRKPSSRQRRKQRSGSTPAGSAAPAAGGRQRRSIRGPHSPRVNSAIFFGFLLLSLSCFCIIMWGMIVKEPWVILALPLMYLPYVYYIVIPPNTA